MFLKLREAHLLDEGKPDNNEGLRREINQLRKGVKTKEEMVAT